MFEQIAKMRELERRAYKRGFEDGLKQKKMLMKEIGKNAKAIYKYYDDDNTVRGSAYSIMLRVDENTDYDFAGMKKFEVDKAKYLEKQAQKK